MFVMRRFIPLFAALSLLLCVAVVAGAESTHPKLPKPPVVVVPCGGVWVPYSIYRLPVAANSAYTMTLQAAGATDGLITFTAQNFTPNGFYWQRVDSTCSTCTLILPNVPASREGIQLAVDVYGGDCPGPGVTVTDFQLQIGAAH